MKGQILGRDQSDHLVAQPYDVGLVPTTQSERTPASTYPRVAGVSSLTANKQIFGVNGQILGHDQSDQGASYAA